MKNQICLVPKLIGLGGMVTFQAKFIQGLLDRGIPYSYDLQHPDNSAVLVIGGTRQLWNLWRTKQKGVSIIQRLNGMNWMHRVEKTPLKAYLRAELNNRLLAFIRKFLADTIVYQSFFSREWWQDVYGLKNQKNLVIHNGVDLTLFRPVGPERPPEAHDRILLVEGHLSGANARGLKTAVSLAQEVKSLRHRPVELMVVGEVSEAVMSQAINMAPNVWITWRGVLPQVEIPAIDRSAHVLFSADLNAACPNSVIEAMACGLPVLAYDTGALKELIQEGAGEVVDYGADHWKLEDPAIIPLARVCARILEDNTEYRQHARLRAETAFGLDKMVDAYLDALGVRS